MIYRNIETWKWMYYIHLRGGGNDVFLSVFGNLCWIPRPKALQSVIHLLYSQCLLIWVFLAQSELECMQHDTSLFVCTCIDLNLFHHLCWCEKQFHSLSFWYNFLLYLSIFSLTKWAYVCAGMHFGERMHSYVIVSTSVCPCGCEKLTCRMLNQCKKCLYFWYPNFHVDGFLCVCAHTYGNFHFSSK